jgi:hypothetical protein
MATSVSPELRWLVNQLHRNHTFLRCDLLKQYLTWQENSVCRLLPHIIHQLLPHIIHQLLPHIIHQLIPHIIHQLYLQLWQAGTAIKHIFTLLLPYLYVLPNQW